MRYAIAAVLRYISLFIVRVSLLFFRAVLGVGRFAVRVRYAAVVPASYRRFALSSYVAIPVAVEAL